MYNNKMYNENQFRQYPYMNSPYYVCPLMQNNYNYLEPCYDNYYRQNYDKSYMLDEYQDIYPNYRSFKITTENIENIAAAVKKDSPNILKDIQKFIKDSRLMDYMLMALITYICRNYDKYQNVIDEKTDELVAEMKHNLPWLFDILKVFGITPEMVDDFLDNLIKLTVTNLRKLIPEAL